MCWPVSGFLFKATINFLFPQSSPDPGAFLIRDVAFSFVASTFVEFQAM